MKTTLTKLFSIIIMLCFMSITQADEGRHNLSIMLGAVKLSDTSQQINGINYEFKDTTFQVFSIDYERLLENGFAFGVNGLAHTNDISYDSSTDPSNGANILHIAGMAKKYFQITNDFQPYLGLGYGVAFTSGVGSNRVSAQTNTHTLAGVKMNHNKYTFKVEYRNIHTHKSAGSTFYLSGQGLLIGITFKLK